MTRKITGAVVNDVNDKFKLESLNLDDQPEANEVLVHMVASGICHTDETVRDGDIGPYPYPAIAGHEGAGIVEKVGNDVTSVKEGDHVILSYDYDGNCRNCLSGQPASCVNWGKLNAAGVRPNGKTPFKRDDGTNVQNFFNQSSFTTETLVQENNVTVIDKDIDLRKVGPLGCGFVTGSGTVFNGLKPEPGSTMVIMGTGAVGIGALMAAKIAGCSHLICVNHHDNRLEVSKQFGATEVINNDKEDWVKKVMEITNGLGADYVIDTTGIPALLKQCVSATAIGGHFAPVAVSQKETNINAWVDLAMNQRHIDGVLMGNAVPQIELKRLISFWKQGNYPFDKLEKFFDFKDINKANKASNDGSVIKPVLIIDKDYQPGK